MPVITIRGKVFDASTRSALSGALVELMKSGESWVRESQNSGIDGSYSLTDNRSTAGGTYVVRISKTGYLTQTITVPTSGDGIYGGPSVYLSATNQPLQFQVRVTDSSSGAALDGASVSVLGVASGQTAGGGLFNFTATQGTYTVTISKSGYNTWSGNFNFSATSPVCGVGLARSTSGNFKFKVTGPSPENKPIAGVQVVVDGKVVATSGSDGWTSPEFSHSLPMTATFQAAGYQSRTETYQNAGSFIVNLNTKPVSASITKVSGNPYELEFNQSAEVVITVKNNGERQANLRVAVDQNGQVNFTEAKVILANGTADFRYVIYMPNSNLNVRLTPYEGNVKVGSEYAFTIMLKKPTKNPGITASITQIGTTAGQMSYSGYVADPIQIKVKATVPSGNLGGNYRFIADFSGKAEQVYKEVHIAEGSTQEVTMTVVLQQEGTYDVRVQAVYASTCEQVYNSGTKSGVIKLVKKVEQGVVTGIVQGSDGVKIAYAYVTLGGVVGTTDAEGSFTITINPGSYTLKISKGGYSEISKSITVKSGQNDLGTLTMQKVKIPVKVKALVTDSDGGVSGAVVTCDGLAFGITNANGYTNEVEIDAGTHTFSAVAAEHETKTISEQIQRDTTVSIELAKKAKEEGNANLIITVTDSSTGLPIEGATVMLTPGSETKATGDDGVAAITIPTGTYDITVSSPGYKSWKLEKLEMLKAQDYIEKASLTPSAAAGGGSGSTAGCATIEGKVTYYYILATKDATVSLMQNGKSVNSTKTDSSGKYTFTNVTPGNYQVVAKIAGWQDATIDVSAPSAVDCTADLTFLIPAMKLEEIVVPALAVGGILLGYKLLTEE